MRMEEEIREVKLLADAIDFIGRIEARKMPSASREDLRVVRAKVEFVLRVLNDKGGGKG